MTNVRHFKASYNNQEYEGIYNGQYPIQAAHKALTQIFRNNPKLKSTTFKLKETTQNSKKKEYSYKGEKIKNEQVVQINNKDITFKYKNNITRLF